MSCDEERRPVADFMRRVYCILWYVYNVVVKKFTFAISSHDELLVQSCE